MADPDVIFDDQTSTIEVIFQETLAAGPPGQQGPPGNPGPPGPNSIIVSDNGIGGIFTQETGIVDNGLGGITL